MAGLPQLSERGVTYPSFGGRDSSPLKTAEQLPVQSERLRFREEGKGVDLPYDPKEIDPLKDYEHKRFVEECQEAARNGKPYFILGPQIMDLLFPQRDFGGIQRPSFMKFDTPTLRKWVLVEIDKVTFDEFDGSKFLETLGEGNLLKRRLQAVLSTIPLPQIVEVSPAEISVRVFESPDEYSLGKTILPAA